MTTLTITAKGQVTLRKEVLKHLGVGPGDKIDFDLMPGGKASVTASQVKRSGSIEDLFGMLGPWNGPPVSLENLKEAAAAGWASAMDYETDEGKSAIKDNAPVSRGLPNSKSDIQKRRPTRAKT